MCSQNSRPLAETGRGGLSVPRLANQWRRACRTVRCARATYHYQSHRDPRIALRQRMREMAQTRVRYGDRKIRVLLNRKGRAVGKHLVYRLYREEGVTLRHRPLRRRKAVTARVHRPSVTRPNDVWALDFVADQLANGHRVVRAHRGRSVYAGECRIEVGQSLRGEHVGIVLNRLTGHRGALTRPVAIMAASSVVRS
jgi:putative transposase